MDNVILYRNINGVQKRDAFHTLNKYVKKIKWKDCNARILDIGSGDGGVTTEILKYFLPNNYKKLIGCDISKKMVDFANDNYKDKRTEFVLCNIESELEKDWENSFDHAFSFYTLHWIKNNIKAYTNIHYLLNKDGDCLLMFLGYMPIYNVFRSLSRDDKWGMYLKDVDNFVSSYHDTQDPVDYISKVISNIGFKHIDVKCQQKTAIYESIEEFKGLITAINVFKIPNSLFDDFLEDFITTVKNNKVADISIIEINGSRQVLLHYDLLIVYGVK